MGALNEPVVAEATLLISNGDTISGVGHPRSRGTSANGGKRLHDYGVGTSRPCKDVSFELLKKLQTPEGFEQPGTWVVRRLTGKADMYDPTLSRSIDRRLIPSLVAHQH